MAFKIPAILAETFMNCCPLTKILTDDLKERNGFLNVYYDI